MQRTTQRRAVQWRRRCSTCCRRTTGDPPTATVAAAGVVVTAIIAAHAAAIRDLGDSAMDDASADIALSAGALMVANAAMKAGKGIGGGAAAAAAAEMCDQAAGVCLVIMKTRGADDSR